MKKPPLVVIVGPTAIGKTRLSIRLAKLLGGEIVSADSMQIYKHMNIGTAKPSLEDRQEAPHHLIDFWDPLFEFSVAQYQEMAKKCIKEIHNRGNLPILAGGTGLYINSVIYPMDFSKVGFDSAFRQKMFEAAKLKDEGYLYALLKKVDPVRALTLSPNDTKRILRALEVFHISGKRMSESSQKFSDIDSLYRIIMIGLHINRVKLYDTIDRRVDDMFENRLIDEVINLKQMGCNITMQSMQGLGYKQILELLEGKMNLSETKELIKRNTRRFAKRQMTWFRKNKNIVWLETDDFKSLDDLADWITLHIKKNLTLNN